MKSEMRLKIVTQATILAAMIAFGSLSWAQDAPGAIAKKIGVIRTISGSTLTLAPEGAAEITVTVEPNARLLRIAPGEKDLKNATPIQLSDLQVGDTVRVRGKASDDGKSIDGLEVIVITRSTLDAVRDQIRQDWQKRGMGGLVHSVDPAAGTVTISVAGFGGSKDLVIHTTKSTIVRRYAPDSVKFDDAKPSALAQIHAGDQLRARGEKKADGSELAAEEIVTGSFRNIAGTVNSADASSNTISVQDLLSKKTVQVKVGADSQLHKLPVELAQRIAMRFKAAMPPGTPGAGGSAAPANGQAGPPAGGAPGGAANGGGQYGGMRQGGTGDFQQMLSRMPAVTTADLHKGDAVLIVSTEGTGDAGGTVVTLLSGVEPILQAAPSASQAMMLTPWSLGGAPGGDAGNQ